MTPTLRSPLALMKDAYALYGAHARQFLTIAVVPVILLFLGALLCALIVIGVAMFVHPILAILLGFGAVAVLFYFAMIAKIALILTVARPETHTTLKNALTAARPLFFSYAIVSLLTGLAVFGGLILLIIPGIIFALWFAFATFTLIIEGKKGRAALGRSRELVRGHMLALLYRGVAFGVAYLLIAFVPVMLLEALVGKGIADTVSMVVSILLAPWSMAFAYLLYTDFSALNASKQAVGSHSEQVTTPPAEIA